MTFVFCNASSLLWCLSSIQLIGWVLGHLSIGFETEARFSVSLLFLGGTRTVGLGVQGRPFKPTCPNERERERDREGERQQARVSKLWQSRQPVDHSAALLSACLLLFLLHFTHLRRKPPSCPIRGNMHTGTFHSHASPCHNRKRRACLP